MPSLEPEFNPASMANLWRANDPNRVIRRILRMCGTKSASWTFRHQPYAVVARQPRIPVHGRMTTFEAPTVEPSHNALVEAIAAERDKEAFAQLFTHFAPRLKSYLLRIGTDESMAEEVAQEAMVMVWRKAESFDRRQASASTWIFTIARNKRIDRLRRERRPELDPDDPALTPTAEASADRVVEAGETQNQLRGAIEKLPAEQSELIRLAYYDDKTHSEIAKDRDLPLGTVKSRIRLALARLRQEVEGFE